MPEKEITTKNSRRENACAEWADENVTNACIHDGE